MKLSKELESALNAQIGTEFAASLSYLAMAAYFEEVAFEGFAHWMETQSNEERDHGMKFYRYVLDRNGDIELPAIPQPKADFESLVDVFEHSLRQEQEVSQSIFNLYKLANDESDFATVSFLKWFVDEQVEEEKNVTDMIDKLKLAGDNPEALLMLDRQAAERVAEQVPGA